MKRRKRTKRKIPLVYVSPALAKNQNRVQVLSKGLIREMRMEIDRPTHWNMRRHDAPETIHKYSLSDIDIGLAE